VHRLLAGLRPETVFVKTHNAIAVQDGVSTVTPEVTAGAIYVVRNPLDVAVSYADHYGLTLDQTVEAISSPENHVVTSETAVFQHLGDWSGHVRSWTEAPGLAPHLVRYEDLLDDPQAGFGRIVRFLGLDTPRARLRRAIRFAAFDEVKRQERRHGFTEKSRSSAAFFRQGKAQQWRKVLTPSQIDAVTRAHGAVMERYGYLP
jgi:LPS sulfotransferase NodH